MISRVHDKPVRFRRHNDEPKGLLHRIGKRCVIYAAVVLTVVFTILGFLVVILTTVAPFAFLAFVVWALYKLMQHHGIVQAMIECSGLM